MRSQYRRLCAFDRRIPSFQLPGKKFYLLDTFQGLDPRFISDAERTRGIDNYKYRDSYAEVVQTFRDFDVRIIRGPVPDTLSQCDTGQICYLSIDMNNVLPEIAALEYFWEKVVDGGFILLDDYGFPSTNFRKPRSTVSRKRVGSPSFAFLPARVLSARHEQPCTTTQTQADEDPDHWRTRFIGSHLTRHFRANGHTVFVCDVKPASGDEFYTCVDRFQPDYASVIRTSQPDACVFAGATERSCLLQHPQLDFQLNCGTCFDYWIVCELKSPAVN